MTCIPTDWGTIGFPDAGLLSAQDGRGLRESGTVQAVQYVVDRARRLLPGVGNGLDGLVHADRVQVELVDQEVVGVFGLDVPVGQYLSGKVAQVESDDDLGPCPDRGGENVSVVEVRQVEGADERFVARNDHVTNGEVHEGPGRCSRVSSRSGRLACRDLKVSSRIVSVHFAWTSPVCASRIRTARSVEGYNTFAS